MVLQRMERLKGIEAEDRPVDILARRLIAVMNEGKSRKVLPRRGEPNYYCLNQEYEIDFNQETPPTTLREIEMILMKLNSKSFRERAREVLGSEERAKLIAEVSEPDPLGHLSFPEEPRPWLP